MTGVNEFTWRYYPVAGASCLVFLCIYKFISPWMSAKLFPKYNKLAFAKQLEWNTRVNSTLHSLIVSCLCLYVFLWEDHVGRDPIMAESVAARAACSILVGYMTADLIAIMVHYKHFGEVSYIFHHCTCIYAYYFPISYGVLSWFAMYRLMAELSTPFVNQRWFLDVLGYPKSSPQFIVNGLAMTVVFCLARIVTIPLYYFKIYTVWGMPGWESLGHVRLVMVYSCFILDALNIFWFYKIFHGAKKVLGQSWQNSKLAKAA